MKKLWPFLLLIVAICGVYAPALQNGFVWDDNALVMRDPLIRSWRLIPEGFQHFLFTDASASDFYRPIQRLTYVFDYAAYRFGPAGYHFTSILCHLFAALALFLFSREFLKECAVGKRAQKLVPLLATLVWAIHPLQSSAVTYISGRADPLAAGFGFLGLFFAMIASRGSKSRVWMFTALALALFLLSALSKEAGLIFPALWIAIILLRTRWKSMLPAGVTLVFVLITYLSFRLPAEHETPPAPRPLPVLVRPILIARAFAEYTGLVLLPLNLRMERDVETHARGFNDESLSAAAWRELQTLAGIVLLAAFVFWLSREWKRDRAIFDLLVLTLLTYLPVSGIFPLNAAVAEHWLYLPGAFLSLAVGLAVARSFDVSRIARLRPLALAALAIWMVFLAGRTFVRNYDWKDQETFLTRTIAAGGNSARMLINLAGVEMNDRRLDEARKHLLIALQEEPDQPLAVINLAAVAIKQNDYKLAHECLSRATQMPLVEAQAYEMLAVLEHKETGKVNFLRLRLAARTGSPNWAMEKRYITVMAEGGALDPAIAELGHCLTSQWYRAESWQLLSELATKAGRPEEATKALAQAHRYDVHLADGKSFF